MSKKFFEAKGLGEILREKRISEGVSIKEASEATRIRREYLQALEEEDYASLPPQVYTKGFVRNYSLYLGISPKVTLALFRRDYSETKTSTKRATPKSPAPKSLPINLNFSANKVIFLIAGALFLLFVFVIIAQIKSVIKEPTFSIISPIAAQAGENRVFNTESEKINFKIQLEVGSTLEMNGVKVDTKGLETFDISDVDLQEGENQFNFTARSPFGVESKINITITRKLSPSITPTEVEVKVTEKTIKILFGPRDAYVELTIDGEKQLSSVQKAGSEKEFTVKSSISISTPRPDSVKITYDDKSLVIKGSQTNKWLLIEGNFVKDEFNQ